MSGSLRFGFLKMNFWFLDVWTLSFEVKGQIIKGLVRGNTCLYLPAGLHHGDGVVAPVLLGLTVLANAAGVGAAENLQGPLVALAGPPLDVPERLHQPVVLELWVLQVRPQVSLAVRHQAGEAGLEGPAGALDARVTHHIVGAQRFLLHFLFFLFLFLRLRFCFCFWFWLFLLLLLRRLLWIFRLLQVLLDLDLLGGLWVLILFAADHRSFGLSPVLFDPVSRSRLIWTLGTTCLFVLEAGATDGRCVCAQCTWADDTGGSCFHCCRLCHDSVFTSSLLKNWLSRRFLDHTDRPGEPHLDEMRSYSFSRTVPAPSALICKRQTVIHTHPHTHTISALPSPEGKEKPEGGAPAAVVLRCRVAFLHMHCVWSATETQTTWVV